jgi:hypothetical protein
MSTVTELHNQAMELVDEAYFARRAQEHELAVQHLRRAFELEREAAEYLWNERSAEPSRSILYRSAAALALQCGDNREAERMASAGLSGNPPADIADELRDIYETAGFYRHLQAQDIELLPTELQLTLLGHAITSDMALTSEFIGRVQDLDRMILRSIERKSHIPFRERGASAQSLTQGYALYMSVPRPGSFNVTLRVGVQPQLPEFDRSEEVLDDVLENLDLLQEGREDELKKRIPQDAYFNNFVALGKRILPDGRDVTFVGLTRRKDGQDKYLGLTHKPQSKRRSIGPRPRIVEITGKLLVADARNPEGTIELVDDSNKSHPITVPVGTMDDVVVPYWNARVTITGVRKNNRLILETVTLARDIEAPA